MSKAPLASVLIVDDEPIIRDTLAEFLHSERMDVVTCATGEDRLAPVRTLHLRNHVWN